MPVTGRDSLKTRRILNVDGKKYDYFSLPAASETGIGEINSLHIP